MTCDGSIFGSENVLFQKTGDNLTKSGYLPLGLVESDEEGERYIYSQNIKANYGMLDFKKRRWYYDYDKLKYSQCF